MQKPEASCLEVLFKVDTLKNFCVGVTYFIKLQPETLQLVRKSVWHKCYIKIFQILCEYVLCRGRQEHGEYTTTMKRGLSLDTFEQFVSISKGKLENDQWEQHKKLRWD